MRSRDRKPFRFSIRELLVTTLVAGAYLACWQPSSVEGPGDVVAHVRQHDERLTIYQAASVLPLLVSVDVADPNRRGAQRRYYLWAFGATLKLPFESALW